MALHRTCRPSIHVVQENVFVKTFFRLLESRLLAAQNPPRNLVTVTTMTHSKQKGLRFNYTPNNLECVNYFCHWKTIIDERQKRYCFRHFFSVTAQSYHVAALLVSRSLHWNAAWNVLHLSIWLSIIMSSCVMLVWLGMGTNSLSIRKKNQVLASFRNDNKIEFIKEWEVWSIVFVFVLVFFVCLFFCF